MVCLLHLSKLSSHRLHTVIRKRRNRESANHLISSLNVSFVYPVINTASKENCIIKRYTEQSNVYFLHAVTYCFTFQIEEETDDTVEDKNRRITEVGTT